MSTSKEYLNFITEKLSGLDDVAFRAMMGEYIIYYKGRIIGGIYDNRLLVKAVPAAFDYVGNAELVLPYEGAKGKMIQIDNVDSPSYLEGLLNAMYDTLPEAKKKRTQK